jgi:hypothetical protein
VLAAVAALAAAEPGDDAALREDWLYQAKGKPLGTLIAQEMTAAREMAEKLAKLPKPPDLSAELAALDQLTKSTPLAAAPQPSTQPAASQPGVKLPDGIVGRWTAGQLGENGYLNVGAKPAAVAAGNYTLCAWVRTTGGEADVIGNGTSVGHFLLMVYRGVVRGHQWTAQGAAVVDGKTRVNDGRWHHVAQVVDGDTLSLVVDGRPDGSMKILGAKTAAASGVTVGARGGESHFEGLLDEVCVFDRALGAEPIAAAFPAERAPKTDARSQPPVAPEDAASQDRYLAVRRVKRQIMLKHPEVDFTSVLFIDQPFPAGGEWNHQAKHRLGRMARGGGQLLVLEGLSPAGEVRKLAPESGAAAFWRLDLSFDARKVLFCMKADGERSFHLYEVNIDGSGVRQLTNSLCDDLDPIYLPGGKIVFSTTRGNTYIRCMPETHAYVLARCDADGRNIYIISRNNECDWLPTLLNDGRMCYSRWEYSDKPLWRDQKLWTVNQDGTGEATFWGSQSAWPDHMAMPRAIPGSRRVMFLGVGHHQWFNGSVGIVDQAVGINYPDGLTRVTWDLAWAEVGAGPVEKPECATYRASGSYRAYHSPHPLSEELFLVSASRSGGRGGTFDSLYLMDVRGNRDLIWRGQHNVLHAMPVRPRMAPPVHPDRVAWPGTGADHKPVRPGMLYNADVYHGVPELPRGSVKSLRIVQQDQKTYSTWRPREAAGSHGPGVSAVQIDAVKRILGTVPVAEDGSVAFEVPPGQALFFQLLDEQGRAVHTMRSFTGAMPGESRGCLGCHEMHMATPSAMGYKGLTAKSAVLTPPPWGAGTTIGYERFVQPVLDKHCGKCHQAHGAPNGGNGKGQAKLDLTLRPGQGAFKEPYLTLVGPLSTSWVRCGGLDLAACIKSEDRGRGPHNYGTVPPMTHLSARSRLIEIAMSGKHNNVRIGGEELARLIAWVDMNAPYRGEDEIRAIPDVPPSVYRNDGVEPPILPRTRTAPVIDRFDIPQDAVPGRDDEATARSKPAR